MPRLGEFVQGYDELTPQEKQELTSGVRKNPSLLADSIPGFSDLKPDEQSEMANRLADAEAPVVPPPPAPSAPTPGMEPFTVYNHPPVPSDTTIYPKMVPPTREMMEQRQAFQEALLKQANDEALQASRAEQEASNLPFGQQFAEQALRPGVAMLNSALAIPAAAARLAAKGGDVAAQLAGSPQAAEIAQTIDQSIRMGQEDFQKATALPGTEVPFKDASIGNMGMKTLEAGASLVPFVGATKAIDPALEAIGLSEAAAPTAVMAAQSIPHNIDAMEKVTGKSGLAETAAGTAVGTAEALIFGKLLSSLTSAPEMTQAEMANLTYDVAKSGTLARLAGIATDAAKGAVTETAKFAPAAAAVEALKYETEKVLKGQYPDISQDLLNRMINAVAESVPMGIAAGAYGGAQPRLELGAKMPVADNVESAMWKAKQNLKPFADQAPDFGPISVNQEAQPVLFRVATEAGKSLDKILEIPREVGTQIAAEGMVDSPTPGQAKEIKIGDKSGFLVAPDTSDPNAPLQFALGTPTGTRVARVSEMDGFITAIKREIANGNMDPGVLPFFEMAGREHPELDNNTKAYIADNIVKFSNEWDGPTKQVVGGRTDQPGPGGKILVSLFSTDPVTREISGRDAIHETYHRAFMQMDPSLRQAFTAWAQNNGYDSDKDKQELFAQIGEAWHQGRLPQDPPSWLKRQFNNAKDLLTSAVNRLSGIKGTVVSDQVSRIIGSREIPNDVAAAFDAPFKKSGKFDNAPSDGYIGGEPSESSGKPRKAMLPEEPSYEPAGSATEATPSQGQVTTRTSDGSLFSQTAPGSETLVPPGETLHSLRNIDTWKADAIRWMKENKFSDEEIRGKIASIDGQVMIMKALVGKDGLEFFPEGAEAAGKIQWKVKGPGAVTEKAGPIRGNQDPLYVISFDLSSECVRRANYVATVRAIQSKLGRPLTDNQALALAAMFRESGEVAPCLYCYVEAPRRKMSELLGKWRDIFDGSVKVPKAEDLAKVEAFKAQGISGKDVDYNFFLDGKNVNDLPEDHIYRTNPEFFKFVRSKVSSQVNVVKSYEEYSGQILDINPNLVNYLKARVGLRFFSSSDFQPEHITDLMQAIHDAETRGLPGHSYTKIPELVEIFGKTGMKINTSLFAHGMGTDGKPVPDEWQGMAWERAFQFRKDHPDVGTVLVATSDDMIRWALNSPDIDYIIPFHNSGVSKQISKSSGWFDYTKKQHEKLIKPIDWKEGKDGSLTATRGDLSFEISKTTRNDKDVFTLKTRRNTGEIEEIEAETESGKKGSVESAMAEAVKILTTVRSNDYLDLGTGTSNAKAKAKYLNICAQRGIEPVFKDFIGHENYIKLKKDFARTDTPFESLRADFDTARAGKITKKFMDARAGEPGADIYSGSSGAANPDMIRKFFKVFPKGEPGTGAEAKAIMTRTNKAIGEEAGVQEYQNLGAKKKTSPQHSLRDINWHAVEEQRKLNNAPNSTPLERVLARMSIKEQQDRPGNSWYASLVDDLEPLREAVQQMLGTSVIPADIDPLTMARLYRGTFGRADAFLRGGTFGFGDLKKKSEPLQNILQDAVKAGTMKEFQGYLGAKRALELQARGINTGIPAADAAATVGQYGAKYGPLADRLYKYQDQVLKYLLDSHVISQRQYQDMKKENKAYVPFYRVMEQTAGSSIGFSSKAMELVTNPLKGIEGSDRRIIDPIESIVKNTFALINAADKNHVARSLVELAERTGANHLIQHDPGAQNTGRSQSGYLKVWADGNVKMYRISPEIEIAMKALDRETANFVMRMLAKPASWLRTGSVLTPEFIGRNPIRDNWEAFIYSKYGFIPGYDTFKGLVHALRQDDTYWKWKAAGGSGADIASVAREYMQESVDKMIAQRGGWATLGRVFTSPMETLRALSEKFEEATRLGEFGAGVRKLGDSKAALSDAAASSRAVTLDFSRAGSAGKAMNMITAFWNAGIQGHDKFVQGHINDPVGIGLKSAMALTLPSAILAYLNADDPRYKDLPQWQKDLFWIVIPDRISQADWDKMTPDQRLKKSQDTVWRLPKPPGLNLLYTLPVERYIQSIAGNDPHALKDLGERLVFDQAPAVIPTGMLPLVEGWTNYSFFTRRPIEPVGSDKKLPEDRSTTGNTVIAKNVARALGNVQDATGLPVRVSPPKMENAARTLTGGLGMHVLRLADWTYRKSTGQEGAPPAWTWSDVPGVRGFTVRYPQPFGENTTRFLDNYALASQRANSGKARITAGDNSGIPLMTSQESIKLDGVKNDLAKLMEAARAIESNPRIDPKSKRDQLDSLYLTMSQVAQIGNKTLDDIQTRKK